MAITFVNAGAVTGGISTVAIPLPASLVSGDILLLWVETENQAVTVSNQNGGTWTEVTTTSPQGTGTAGGPGGTRLTCFWSRYNGTQGNPTVSDSGDHQRGVIVAYRGCIGSGDPWDVKAGDVLASASTTVTIPGATTTTDGCMAAFGVANTTDSSVTQMSSFTNANLTSVSHRAGANSTTANGGGLNVGDGLKATAGAIGNTTGTLVTSSVQGRIMVALKPAAGGTTVTPGLGAPVFAGLGPIIALAISAGVGGPVFSGLAPTVAISSNQIVQSGLGAPVFAGQSPAVVIGSATVVQPGTAAPVFTGLAPTNLVTVRIPIGLGAPVFTGLAPVVAISDNKFPAPGLGQPSFTGFAPSVVAAVTAKPGIGAPAFTGLAPLAVLSDNQIASVGLGQPSFTGFAPTVSVALASGLVRPGFGQGTFTGFSPTVVQPLREPIAIHFAAISLPAPHQGAVAISRIHGTSVMDNLTTADAVHDTSSTALNTSSAPMGG